ncbi:MAG TPA: helix-turn-helix domain-containing protein [Sphingopyxis sp.]|nr:helix-turn-helix domain-containing protein [Sphingopyxis sp.]
MVITAYLDDQEQQGGKRRNARRNLRLPTRGISAARGATEVLIHNISASGLLLESEAALAPGEEIAIELPHAGTTAARVIWASGRLYGCEFDVALSAGALSAVELRSTVSRDIASSDKQLASPPAEDFGHRLKQLRKAKGLTQAQMASQLGVSMPAICAWETGKARPRDARMKALANALGIPMSELFGPDVPEMLEDLLARSREQIARVVGTTPDKIRIMIEI